MQPFTEEREGGQEEDSSIKEQETRKQVLIVAVGLKGQLCAESELITLQVNKC
jgi:hypothetical protein